MNLIDFKEELLNFKEDIFKSKKYWILYLSLILFFSLSMFDTKNYLHPKMEIAIIILLSIIGTLCIIYFNKHDSDKELYKTAFIIILTFGVICSILTPICYVPDEVEHFVRSEMTSRGEFIPNYHNNSYLTIQTTLDLIDSGVEHVETGFDRIYMDKSTIFNTPADTEPINNTLVNYPSAFAQNPFFGYLPQAIGMLIAKVFNLNAIWLLWLGRILNILLYASLIALSVKKTPVLKIPFIVISIMPLIMFQSSSVSIDSLINGLAIFCTSYFIYMYKSEDYAIDIKDILKFSLICLLLGLCKVTFFTFILLILFVPKNKFEKKSYYYLNILIIIILTMFAVLWAKFYGNPKLIQSFRGKYYIIHNINSTQQILFLLTNKNDSLLTLLQLPQYWDTDLLFNSRSLWFNKFNSIYLMFLGSICLLYPHKRFNLKSRLGSLLVCSIIYVGTYFSFLLTWTSVGQLKPIDGVQPRYFLPLFTLLPIIFGINNTNNNNKSEIDSYLIVLSITFLTLMLISMVISVY